MHVQSKLSYTIRCKDTILEEKTESKLSKRRMILVKYNFFGKDT